ncbi:hypothetical protein GCM10009664_72170 [Kitasatospora gansuensis]
MGIPRLAAVGVVLAGRGGARMLSILNITLSRFTVLAQLMLAPLPPLVTRTAEPVAARASRCRGRLPRRIALLPAGIADGAPVGIARG